MCLGQKHAANDALQSTGVAVDRLHGVAKLHKSQDADTLLPDQLLLERVPDRADLALRRTDLRLRPLILDQQWHQRVVVV